MGVVSMAGIFDQITGQTNADPQPAEHQTTGGEAEQNFSALEQDGASPLQQARTDQTLREATQELLRVGLLEQSLRPNLYRAAIVSMDKINVILEPLDLAARADDIRGLVFLTVRSIDSATPNDEWTHPLVRKQRLNLEQTLLVAILRQYFIAHEQEAGTGSAEAVVTVDELIPQLQVYLGDSGSEARERTRALQLLDQLKGHGLVSAPDSHERISIRPIITHLANPENLTALLHTLKSHAASLRDEGES